MGHGLAERWLFRVASAPRHGGGHLSRCLVLANAMRSIAPIGMEFHLDPDSDAAAQRVRAAGHDVRTDTGAAVSAAAGCVLDGYELSGETTDRYAQAGPLVFLDDLGMPPRAADLAVNAGFQMTGREIAGIPALLGPRYALIDPAFSPVRDPAEQVGTVLISMGRADTGNATALTLKALSILCGRGFSPDIVVALGSECPHLTHVRDQFSRYRGNAELVVDTGSMAELMAAADLVIGAGGVGLQERAAMGVPSVTLVLADNQAPATEAAIRAGVTIFGQAADRTTPDELAKVVLDVANNREMRRNMTSRGRNLIDGKGAVRVAKAVLLMQRRGTPAVPDTATIH
ncbi:PseG/SpsG family protein [Hwanghaeella sp.]|uniref:PseG/SpsG family protein n=1 Tax=Hwanghaeella sp. TaxID=2605943 RepID=UPI003CCC2701